MMRSLEAELSRALDMIAAGNAQQAQATLTTLLDDWRTSERDRMRKLDEARHEIGNALSIAQASVEAMLDGVVGITDQRLNRIRDILSGVSASMYALTASDEIGGAKERS
jgi:hypothetical protein